MSGGATGAGGSNSAYSGAPMIGGPSAPQLLTGGQSSAPRMGIGQGTTMNGQPGQQPQYGTRPANYGWSPSPASAAFNSPSYPQLYGGQWNQLAQMMAGPSYSAAAPVGGIAPAAQQTPGQAAALPNQSNALAQLLNRNAGSGYGVGGYMTGGGNR